MSRSEFRIDVRVGSLLRHVLHVAIPAAIAVGAVLLGCALLHRPPPSLELLLGLPGAILVVVALLASRTRLVAEQITKSVRLETRHAFVLKKGIEIPFSQIAAVVLTTDPEGTLVRRLRTDVWGVGLQNGVGETYHLIFTTDEVLIRQITAGIARASGARVRETDTSCIFRIPEERAARFRKKSTLIRDSGTALAAEIAANLGPCGPPAEEQEPRAEAEVGALEAEGEARD